mgnify:CR=1 FL=1
MCSFIILLYMLTTRKGPAQGSLAPIIPIYTVLGQLGGFLIEKKKTSSLF